MEVVIGDGAVSTASSAVVKYADIFGWEHITAGKMQNLHFTQSVCQPPFVADWIAPERSRSSFASPLL